MPGHQTDCAARLRHLVMPWCPVCILCRISVRRLGGITSRLPRNNSPLATHSSLATCKYGL